MSNDPSCKSRVKGHLKNRVSDLRKLFKAYQMGWEDRYPDIGTFAEYGLCFDYVAPNTFNDQPQGYFRYQLSTGGPGDEFRFYVNLDLSVYKIEYWFLDWFDGAKVILKPSQQRYKLLLDIYEFFNEIGSCQSELDRAMES